MLLEPQEDRFFLNSPFLLVVMLDVVLKARRRDQDDAINQHPQEDIWIVKILLAWVSPFTLPYA